MIIKCIGCGEDFYIRPSRYAIGIRRCSTECRRTAKKLTCTTCGKEIFVIPSAIKENGNYCSFECWKKSAMGEEVPCTACGKLHYRKKSKLVDNGNGYFCSHDCWNQWYGRHRKSYKRNRAKQLAEFKRFKLAVLERDSLTCQHCGSRDNLNVHHIIPWAADEALRCEVTNGITLCKRCHNKEHRRLNKLIKQQIDIFADHAIHRGKSWAR